MNTKVSFLFTLVQHSFLMSDCPLVIWFKNILISVFKKKKDFFFASLVGFPLYPEILQYYTMILQRHRIIVGDAGFEPGTSGALPNEPLLYISNLPTAILFIQQACLLNSMTKDCKKRVKHFPKICFLAEEC